MKLSASLLVSDSTRSCQVSAELELDDSIAAEGISAHTSELLKGLQAGFADAVANSRTAPIPTAVPLTLFAGLPSSTGTEEGVVVREALPSERVTAPTRKQRPDDRISAKQRKYLNDLLRINDLDLAAWCREKNTSENQITAAHCRQWIPELQEMANRKGFSA